MMSASTCSLNLLSDVIVVESMFGKFRMLLLCRLQVVSLQVVGLLLLVTFSFVLLWHATIGGAICVVVGVELLRRLCVVLWM